MTIGVTQAAVSFLAALDSALMPSGKARVWHPRSLRSLRVLLVSSGIAAAIALTACSANDCRTCGGGSSQLGRESLMPVEPVSSPESKKQTIELPRASSLPILAEMELDHGWKAYSERYPALVESICTARLTAPRQAAAIRVDALVDRLPYRPDPPELDHWDHKLPGDCEDFALMKRRLLAGGQAPREWGLRLAGDEIWPLGAVRVAIGEQFNPTSARVECHAVLHLVTDRGDFELNMRPFTSGLSAWNDSGFKPLFRTSNPGLYEIADVFKLPDYVRSELHRSASAAEPVPCGGQ